MLHWKECTYIILEKKYKYTKLKKDNKVMKKTNPCVSITKNERYKIYRNPFSILIFLVFFIINGIFVYNYASNNLIESDVYQKVYAHIQTLPEEEKIPYIISKQELLDRMIYFETGDQSEIDSLNQDENFEYYYNQYQSGNYLNFSDNLIVEKEVFHEFAVTAKEISHYDEYLENIKKQFDQSKTISIFQNNNKFSQRDAQATVKAFSNIEIQTPKFVNSHVFYESTDFIFTDMLIIVLVIYMVITLFSSEKEKGLFTLIKPLYKSGKSLLLAKIFAILLFCIIFSTLFWSSNLWITTIKYGYLDFGAPLQSISGFVGSALNISIGGYIILFMIIKVFIYLLIALVIIFMTMFFKNPTMIYLSFVIYIGLSFLLYQFIDGKSALQLFKYINIVNFISVNSNFKYYFNLNFLQYPISISAVLIIFLLLSLLLFIFTNMVLFCKCNESHSGFKRRKKLTLSNFRIHTSLVYHEMYKLFICQRALLILILFIAVQFCLFTQNDWKLTAQESYYKQYMTSFEGELTETKLKIVQDEKNMFLYYENMLNESKTKYDNGQLSKDEFKAVQQLVAEKIKTKAAFQEALLKINYVQEYNEKYNDKLPLVYDAGYNLLMGNSSDGNNQDLIQTLIIMITMICTFGGYFAYEFSSEMINILKSCKKGNLETVKAKLKVSLGLLFVLFVIGYLQNIIYIQNLYGLHYLNKSIYTIQNLSSFPVPLNLWQYISFVYIEKFIVYICIMTMMFALSVLTKKNIKTIVVLSCIFVLPLILNLLGFTFVNYFSFNIFLSGNQLFDMISENSACIFLLIIPIVCFIISIIGLMYNITAQNYGTKKCKRIKS